MTTNSILQGSDTAGSSSTPGKCAAGDGSDKDRNSATSGKDDKLLEDMDDEVEDENEGGDGDEESDDDFGDENE